MNTEIHDNDGAVLRTPSPEYIARVKELERYLPVMTKAEQDQLIYLKRTDWPEETLIKWSGKLAERNAMRAEVQRRAYSRQPALRPKK
ncbi:MAG: hypothetical protein II841_11465 [Bacteroidales bacterium]|nr:hypothetical protein [Bacteroidales bacterium]